MDVGELGKRTICAGIKEYYSIVKDINNSLKLYVFPSIVKAHLGNCQRPLL
ncbi:MAG: hypothetical protein WC584_05355 [Candidatus Pacearchaeota archaeon]